MNLKKKVKNPLIGIVALLLLLGCIYRISHSTYYKYNNWLIIGSSYNEVEKIYGEFDMEYSNKKGYYIGYDNSAIMPSHQTQYYWMEYDENGIITNVYIGTRPGG